MDPGQEEGLGSVVDLDQNETLQDLFLFFLNWSPQLLKDMQRHFYQQESRMLLCVIAHRLYSRLVMSIRLFNGIQRSGIQSRTGDTPDVYCVD